MTPIYDHGELGRGTCCSTRATQQEKSIFFHWFRNTISFYFGVRRKWAANQRRFENRIQIYMRGEEMWSIFVVLQISLEAVFFLSREKDSELVVLVPGERGARSNVEIVGRRSRGDSSRRVQRRCLSAPKFTFAVSN